MHFYVTPRTGSNTPPQHSLLCQLNNSTQTTEQQRTDTFGNKVSANFELNFWTFFVINAHFSQHLTLNTVFLKQHHNDIMEKLTCSDLENGREKGFLVKTGQTLDLLTKFG